MKVDYKDVQNGNIFSDIVLILCCFCHFRAKRLHRSATVGTSGASTTPPAAQPGYVKISV